MKKFVIQPENGVAVYDTTSSDYAALIALPEKRRPKFLDEGHPDVVAAMAGIEAKHSKAQDGHKGPRKSALAKLEALGLTDQELKALFG